MVRASHIRILFVHVVSDEVGTWLRNLDIFDRELIAAIDGIFQTFTRWAHHALLPVVHIYWEHFTAIETSNGKGYAVDINACLFGNGPLCQKGEAFHKQVIDDVVYFANFKVNAENPARICHLRLHYDNVNNVSGKGHFVHGSLHRRGKSATYGRVGKVITFLTLPANYCALQAVKILNVALSLTCSGLFGGIVEQGVGHVEVVPLVN